MRSQTLPRPRLRSDEEARARARVRARLSARAGTLFLIVLLTGFLAIVPAREYLAQRARIADLERRAQILEKANTDLSTEIDRLHDPVYLERLARECLGMVKPGEKAFVVVPADGEQPDTAC